MQRSCYLLLSFFLLFLNFELSAQDYTVLKIERKAFLERSLDQAMVYSECGNTQFGLRNYEEEITEAEYEYVEKMKKDGETFFYVRKHQEEFFLDSLGRKISFPLMPVLAMSKGELKTLARIQNEAYTLKEIQNRRESIDYRVQKNAEDAFNHFFKPSENQLLLFKEPIKDWGLDTIKNRLWVETKKRDYVFDEKFNLLLSTKYAITTLLDSHYIVLPRRKLNPFAFYSNLRRLSGRFPLKYFDIDDNKGLMDSKGQLIFPFKNEYYAIWKNEKGKNIYWTVNHGIATVYNEKLEIQHEAFLLGREQNKKSLTLLQDPSLDLRQYSDLQYEESRALGGLQNPEITAIVFTDPKTKLKGLRGKNGDIILAPMYSKFNAPGYRKNQITNPYRQFYEASETTYSDYISGNWIYASTSQNPLICHKGDSIGLYFNQGPPNLYQGKSLKVVKVLGRELYEVQGELKQLLFPNGKAAIKEPATGFSVVHEHFILAHHLGHQSLYRFMNGNYKRVLDGDLIKRSSGGLRIQPLNTWKAQWLKSEKLISAEINGNLRFYRIENDTNLIEFERPVLDRGIFCVYGSEKIRNDPLYSATKIVVNKDYEVLERHFETYLPIGDGYNFIIDYNTSHFYSKDGKIIPSPLDFTHNKSSHCVEFKEGKNFGVYNYRFDSIVLAANDSNSIHFIGNEHFQRLNKLYSKEGKLLMEDFSGWVRWHDRGFIFKRNDKYGLIVKEEIVVPALYDDLWSNRKYLHGHRNDLQYIIVPGKEAVVYEEEFELGLAYCNPEYKILKAKNRFRLMTKKGKMISEWYSKDSLVASSAWEVLMASHCFKDWEELPEYVKTAYQWLEIETKTNYSLAGFKNLGGWGIVNVRTRKDKNYKHDSWAGCIWFDRGSLRQLSLHDFFEVDAEFVELISKEVQTEFKYGKAVQTCYSPEVLNKIFSSFWVFEDHISFDYNIDTDYRNQVSVQKSIPLEKLQKHIKKDGLLSELGYF